MFQVALNGSVHVFTSVLGKMMVYAARYNLFATDKRNFLAQVGPQDLAKAGSLASQHSFPFLARNRILIEQEFNQMYTALSLKDEAQAQDEFWLYCYYCCIMLRKYYSNYAYKMKDQAEKYRKLSEKLAYRCKYKQFKDGSTEDSTFKQLLKAKLTADLNSFFSTPQHTTKIRDWLGFTNIYRILFLFSRLTIRQSLAMAKELKWFEKLDKLLGRHVDVDKMINVIKAPTAIFNVFSVGLFAARFIVNTGVLLKHTFDPTYAEKSLNASERFCRELLKRHCTMLNDFAWFIINLLTNYSVIFGISATQATILTVVFLFFDAALLIYRKHLAEQEYFLKKAQYINDKLHYETLFSHGQLSYEAKQRHLKMLDNQLMQLEISRRSTIASLHCNLTAALLLAGGFSASMLMTSLAAIAVCYLVCTIGVATYLSADTYGKYAEKSLVLQKCKLGQMDGMNLVKARNEMKSARTDFILAMFKNTLMPLFVVTTFAICWPAALILTAIYIGYECFKGYVKPSPEKKKPCLPSPIAMNEEEGETTLEHRPLIRAG